jgi:RNA polymerase sigma factor (sigma-70 family)
MVRSDNHKVFSKLESKQLNKEEQIIKNQIIDLVKDCIDDLPYKFKEVVKLRIYNQLTFKDISKQLDVKINTVQGRFRYGLRDLKESHGLKQILNR